MFVNLFACAALLFGIDPNAPHASTMTQLLMRSDVERELELTDVQVQAFRSQARAVQALKVKIDAVSNDESLSGVQRRQRRAELTQSLSTLVLSTANEYLLPHQRMRLEQLAWQWLFLKNPSILFGTNRASGEHVEATRVITQSLRSLEHAERTFHRDGAVEILKTLTPEQRAFWTEATGVPFAF